MTTQTKTTMPDRSREAKTGWRKVKLGEAAYINMGQSPRSEFYNSRGEGLPFYQGVTDFGKKYPKKSMYCSQPAKIAERGDIFFSVRAPVGDVNVATEKSCIGRGVAALRMKNGNNEFLYFLLKNYERYFKGIAGGTTYESINKDQIQDIELFIPENSVEQKRIANILSAFDKKIEVNNKISQTLEQMAQAIFKEWFAARSEAFLAKEGKLLKGWAVKRLGEVIQLEYGKALKAEERESGNVVVVGSSGVVGSHNERLVVGPGIVVGRKGTVGSIHWIDGDFYPIDTTFYVKTPISLYFCFYILKRQKFVTGDSAVPGLNRDVALSNSVIMPPKELLAKFDLLVAPMFKKMYQVKIENQKLATLRDLLLPKLMSGEIKV